MESSPPDLRLEQERLHALGHAVDLHLAVLGQLQERLDRLQVAADPEGHQAGHTQLLERPGHLASRALGPDGYPGQAFGVAGAVEAVADSPEVDLAARVGGHPVGEAAGAVGDHLHGVARAHEPGVVEPLRNVVEVMLGPGGPPSCQVEQDLGSRDDIHATSSRGLLLKYFITDIIPLYAPRSLVPEARSHRQEGGSPFAKMNGATRVGRARNERVTRRAPGARRRRLCPAYRERGIRCIGSKVSAASAPPAAGSRWGCGTAASRI